MKSIVVAVAILIFYNAKSQTALVTKSQADTIKCYVQIMVPASATIGMSKEIEDNQLFFNGGILLYTKAYAIRENDRYVKFLKPNKKELKNIWSPDDKPVVMKFEW